MDRVPVHVMWTFIFTFLALFWLSIGYGIFNLLVS